MLHYTTHAKERMTQRGIKEEEVEACLNNHDISYPSDDDDDCVNYVSSFPDGRKIRVVVNDKNPNHRIIVSAMVD